MISDLSTCARNQRGGGGGGGEENNSPLLDSHFFHSNFPAPNKSFFFFFVQIAAKSWRSDSWMMSRIIFAAFRIIILAPPTLLRLLLLLFSKHRRVSANIILEMNPFLSQQVPKCTFLKIPSQTTREECEELKEKKKESHPLQDYCKSFEAAETLQRRKKIQEPQDRREFYSQPIHSRTGFNPSESKCAPTSSPPPPSW